MDEFYLRIPARIEYLNLATTLCRKLCSHAPKQAQDKDLVEDIELCISEACTNAIKYGCGGGEGDTISIKFLLFSERVIIQVGDQGEGFELEQIPVPDLDTHPERGYGLYIIRAKMDNIRYVRSPQGNYLEMTKLFNVP
jgi:serine/threonine-protein kinase RsbW